MRPILAYCLSAVFILSSITKAVGLPSFAGEVNLYLEIYFGGWLAGYSMYLAGTVCLLELLIGVSCLLPLLCTYANIAAFLALTFFVYLTATNYFLPPLMGPIESCGCFGELIHFTPFGAFVKSLVLWILILACIVMDIKTVAQQESHRRITKKNI